MKLSDSEWTVMNVVWQRSPASARDVLEGTAEATGWAYSTVKTILTRLVEKGALSEHKRANTSLYEPCVTREKARREAVRSLLDRAFEGTFGTLLQHLVSDEKLSAKDRDKLSAMLAEQDGKGGAGDG